MAYEILTESYGRRLPKITAEADSTDDLATLGTNYAEGSTCVIGDKTYSLDKVQGWVEPGSGGGSGGAGDKLQLTLGDDFGAQSVPATGSLQLTLSKWEDENGTAINEFNPMEYKAFVIQGGMFNTALIIKWFNFYDAVTYGDPAYVSIYNPTGVDIEIASSADFSLNIFGLK